MPASFTLVTELVSQLSSFYNAFFENIINFWSLSSSGRSLVLYLLRRVSCSGFLLRTVLHIKVVITILCSTVFYMENAWGMGFCKLIRRFRIHRIGDWIIFDLVGLRLRFETLRSVFRNTSLHYRNLYPQKQFFL